MKKITSTKLTKKLAKYGALTVALAGITDASGQIVYTDVDPDFAGSTTDSYGLDLNNDGTIDFNFNGGYVGYLYLEPTAASNSFLGSGSGNFTYPFNLSSGASIAPEGSTWFNNGFSDGFASLNYGSCSFGNFCDVVDGYIGLRFTFEGNLHYGWVRLDTNEDSSFTIKDYAFNATPDEAITAGQETLGIEDAAINAIRVVALNKSIALYNLPAQTNYRLIDMSGKQVLNGSSSQNIHTIEARTLSNGVFILEIEDANTKAVLKKKVVL